MEAQPFTSRRGAASRGAIYDSISRAAKVPSLEDYLTCEEVPRDDDHPVPRDEVPVPAPRGVTFVDDGRQSRLAEARPPKMVRISLVFKKSNRTIVVNENPDDGPLMAVPNEISVMDHLLNLFSESHGVPIYLEQITENKYVVHKIYDIKNLADSLIEIIDLYRSD
mgnify:CR=1 FL=1